MAAVDWRHLDNQLLYLTGAFAATKATQNATSAEKLLH